MLSASSRPGAKSILGHRKASSDRGLQRESGARNSPSVCELAIKRQPATNYSILGRSKMETEPACRPEQTNRGEEPASRLGRSLGRAQLWAQLNAYN